MELLIPVELHIHLHSTARFVAVLKHFYFLNFIPSDIVFYSLYFSLAYFIVRRH